MRDERMGSWACCAEEAEWCSRLAASARRPLAPAGATSNTAASCPLRLRPPIHSLAWNSTVKAKKEKSQRRKQASSASSRRRQKRLHFQSAGGWRRGKDHSTLHAVSWPPATAASGLQACAFPAPSAACCSRRHQRAPMTACTAGSAKTAYDRPPPCQRVKRGCSRPCLSGAAAHVGWDRSGETAVGGGWVGACEGIVPVAPPPR